MIRAASVTILILVSCLLCWLPVSISHLLICPKVELLVVAMMIIILLISPIQGCKFTQSDLNPVEGFVLHSICNSLVILKSIFNSIVFALRNDQVIMMMTRTQ